MNNDVLKHSENKNPANDTMPVIDLTPSEYSSTDNQQAIENPVIIIESDATATPSLPLSPQRRWPWIAGGIVTAVVLVALMLCGWHYYWRYINLGIPVSVSVEENIARLAAPAPATKVSPAVVLKHDSILGVALNLYELRGLKAEITNTEPDSSDTSVMLYSRCSDYAKNGKYLGSLVEGGKELQADASRLGYFAAVGSNMVIGVARKESVKDYCVEQGGHFFRQFILLSDGVMPRQYYLHGKVERRGLGRMGSSLYYIETLHPETMWDFADALREYGFTDAIYITGGNNYSYYRTADGQRHDIGVRSAERKPKSNFIPWLVFKK